MDKFHVTLFISVFMLTGCASFYNEKTIKPPQLSPAVSSRLAGRTVNVEVFGGRCQETGELFGAMPGFVRELGLTKIDSTEADYQFRARIVRCKGFDDSLHGSGANALHYILFAASIMTVPYYYDEDLQIELTVSKNGKELYKGQQGGKSFVIGGWLVAPLSVTNFYGNHYKPLIRNVLNKQLVEISEQGVFE